MALIVHEKSSWVDKIMEDEDITTLLKCSGGRPGQASGGDSNVIMFWKILTLGKAKGMMMLSQFNWP